MYYIHVLARVYMHVLVHNRKTCILVTEMHFQKKQLGIDDEFLSHQASVSGWNVEELIEQVN